MRVINDYVPLAALMRLIIGIIERGSGIADCGLLGTSATAVGVVWSHLLDSDEVYQQIYW
jgi:hypothetical protein